MANKLDVALGSVDWNKNVKDLCSSISIAKRIENCNLRLAVWSRQLELVEATNPAIAFMRELQHGGHNVACTIALALYKPASSFDEIAGRMCVVLRVLPVAS